MEETTCRFCNVKLPEWKVQEAIIPSAPPLPSIRDYITRLCLDVARPAFLSAHEPPMLERNVVFVEGPAVKPTAFNIVLTDSTRRVGTCKVFNHAKNMSEFQTFVRDNISRQYVIFAYNAYGEVSLLDSTIESIPGAIHCMRAMGATRVVCASAS